MSETRPWLDGLSRAQRAELLTWVWDTQDEGTALLDGERRVLDTNRAACALLGVDRDALLGSVLPDPPLEDDTVRVSQHRRDDPELGAIELVTLADVAAEVRARQAVERVAESIEEFLFTTALDARGGLSVVYAGPGIERLLGGAVPPGVPFDDAWFGAIHPDDRELARASVRETAAGHPTTVEYRLVGYDGRVRWVRSRTQRREEGGAVLFDGIASDVTAARLVEEEMTRFRAVVEASGSAIAMLDPDWRVRWMNGTGLAMVGLPDVEAAAGMPYLELVGDEARAAHLNEERPTVARDGRWSGESVLLPADRSRRPVPVDATTYRIEHPVTGEHLGLACIRRDISDIRRLAREHEAIGNLASTIAAGVGREEIYEAACREAAHLLGADAGAIAVLGGGTHGPRTVGTWRAPGADDRLELAIGRLGTAVRGGGAAQTLDLGSGHHGVGAPVMVDGLAWGLITACRAGGTPFGGEDTRALHRLGGLVGTAVGVATSRELLVRQATTDGLTGLCNHRAFHDLLRGEAARSARYGRPLAIVLVDLDRFKEVNDRHGHQTGDALLQAVARALEGVVRETEVVARLGGDEFALLLPETRVDGAVATAERVRATVAALAAAADHGVTVSAGVADLEQAATADELIRLADGALYWSKVHGRDRVSAYDPERVEALSAAERAERLARGGALGAVRVLARLIDLKDASTHRHSERVAELAVGLAEELGWPEERRGLLRDAALVHDVGKVVIDDAVLAKPSALTSEEYEVVKRHAPTGAAIAAEALNPEQTAWIAQHHERPDGAGYPAGLTGAQISEGARILAFADVWDVMTSERPYKLAKSDEDALAECRALVGRQFDADVVAAFEQLYAREAVPSRATG